MAIDFMINLLASVVFFVLGYSINSLRKYLKLRPYRKLWEPFLKESKSLVVVSTRPGPHARSTLRVSFTEMEGYVEVSKLLSELGSNARVVTDEISPDEVRSNNLIILGSPAANRVSDMIWQEISGKLPFVFHLPEQSISIGDRSYIPKEDSEGVLETDYGLIVKSRNPFNQLKSMVIALGCHGLSTYGTMSLMTELESVKGIVKSTQDADFVALVQFQLKGNRIISSKILESYVLAHPS